MIINPIYKKESLITWKNIGLIILIFFFNVLLLSYYIIKLNIGINNININLELNYQSFLYIFKNVLLIEYIVILIILPIIAGQSISKEIERKTLELILSTILKPRDIILGKFFCCIVNMSIVLMGTGPILALVFIYGGLSMFDFFRIILSFIMFICFISSMSIYISAFLKKTGLASIVSYIACVICVILSFIITPLNSLYISLNYINVYTDFINSLYLNFDKNFDFLSIQNKFLFGIVMQFLFSIIFLVLAIKSISPIKNVDINKY